MPRRRKTERKRTLNHRDVEELRSAIQAGYPWISHSTDNKFRETGLSSRQNILLTYVVGISAGIAVFNAGEEHPSPEVVRDVRAELAEDIAAAEKRYEKIFTGKHHPQSFFRYRNATQEEWWPPYGPPRRGF